MSAKSAKSKEKKEDEEDRLSGGNKTPRPETAKSEALDPEADDEGVAEEEPEEVDLPETLKDENDRAEEDEALFAADESAAAAAVREKTSDSVKGGSRNSVVGAEEKSRPASEVKVVEETADRPADQSADPAPIDSSENTEEVTERVEENSATPRPLTQAQQVEEETPGDSDKPESKPGSSLERERTRTFHTSREPTAAKEDSTLTNKRENSSAKKGESSPTEEKTPTQAQNRDPTPENEREPTPPKDRESTSEREPTPAKQREPTAAEARQPTPAKEREPTNVEEQKEQSATPVNERKHTSANEREPTLVKEREPTYVEEHTANERDATPKTENTDSILDEELRSSTSHSNKCREVSKLQESPDVQQREASAKVPSPPTSARGPSARPSRQEREKSGTAESRGESASAAETESVGTKADSVSEPVQTNREKLGARKGKPAELRPVRNAPKLPAVGQKTPRQTFKHQEKSLVPSRLSGSMESLYNSGKWSKMEKNSIMRDIDNANNDQVQNNDQNRGLYLQTIRAAVKKLKALKTFDTLEAQQAVYMLVFASNKTHALDVCEILIQEKTAETIVRMVKKLTSGNVFMTDLTWGVTYGLMMIMTNYADKSQLFAKELADAGAVPVLCSNLQHKPYLSLMKTSKNVTELISLTLASLYHLAKVPEARHHCYRADVKKAITGFLRSEQHDLRLFSHLIMTNLYSSTYFSVENGDGILFQTLVSDEEEKTRLEVLDAFCKLALDKDNMDELLKLDAPADLAGGYGREETASSGDTLISAGLLQILSMLIQTGTEDEKQKAVEVVWAMALCESTHADITTEPQLLGTLEEMAENENKSAAAIVWLLKGTARGDSDSKSQLSGVTVFMSYTENYQRVVTEVSRRLQTAGVTVSNVASSAPIAEISAAIAQSQFFICCNAERYKETLQNRTEYEEAMSRSKQLVVLKMEYHMSGLGWQPATQHRALIDFSGKTYPFPDAIQRLFRALGLTVQDAPKKRGAPYGQSKSTPGSMSWRNNVPRTNQAVLRMSREQVQSWMKGIGLEDYAERFGKYDGRMLDNLHLLHDRAPEFTSQSLSQKLEGDIDNVLLFITELDNLYK